MEKTSLRRGELYGEDMEGAGLLHGLMESMKFSIVEWKVRNFYYHM